MTPRIALAVAGLASLALPLPGLTVAGIGLTVVGLAALWFAVPAPGSAAPAVLVVVAALSWLASDNGNGGGGGGGGGGLHDPRLFALAFALAVVHSSAALAAVVPARARVPGPLLLRWAAWTAAATCLGAGVVVGAALLPAAPAVGGTLVAVPAVGGLAVLTAVFGAGVRRQG